MVQLQNFFFFITSMVMPRGTAAPVLLKLFFSRDVPTSAPSSNGTLIPILIPEFPFLVYLHSRKFIRFMDGAKSGVLVRASRPNLLPDIIGRSSSTRNALFRFVAVLHFLLLLSVGHIYNLSTVCSVYYSFVLSSLYQAIGQRSVSWRGEGNAKHFGLTGMSNDEMTNEVPRAPPYRKKSRRVLACSFTYPPFIGGCLFGGCAARNRA